MKTDIAIRLLDLSKTFGCRKEQVKAVRSINLEVASGQVYGFLGPNGAGKSTTIRMIMDLIRPSRGEVHLYGQPLKQNRAILHQRVGGLVEGAAFYPFLTGRRNLELIARTGGFYDAERIGVLLEQVNMADRADREVKGYSTGMKQRLGLAAAHEDTPRIVRQLVENDVSIFQVRSQRQSLEALILVTFTLTSLIFGFGFGILARIVDAPYWPDMSGEIVREFLGHYILEVALAFISVMVTAVYAALAAIVMRSILGGTMVGIGFSLIDPLVFGMIGWWADLFNNVALLHLGRISLFYNIGNVKSWIHDDQAVTWLEPAFQMFNEAAPVDSMGFSMLMLAVWLVGGIGLVLYLFQRQDITT